MYPKEFRENKDKIAKACTKNARISLKSATIVCREVRKRKYVEKAIKFLEDLVEKKVSIRGKYYTNAAKELLKFLKSAIKNAEYKKLSREKLVIAYLAPNKGESFFRARRKSGFGRRMKSTHLSVVLKEA